MADRRRTRHTAARALYSRLLLAVVRLLHVGEGDLRVDLVRMRHRLHLLPGARGRALARRRMLLQHRRPRLLPARKPVRPMLVLLHLCLEWLHVRLRLSNICAMRHDISTARGLRTCAFILEKAKCMCRL